MPEVQQPPLQSSACPPEVCHTYLFIGRHFVNHTVVRPSGKPMKTAYIMDKALLSAVCADSEIHQAGASMLSNMLDTFW
jgi:hypothetical protein